MYDRPRNLVYTGAVAPEGLTLDVSPDCVEAPDTALDLTMVASAVLHVTDPTGLDRFWPATLSNQTPTTLRLTYVYLAADIDLEGEGWRVVARLTLGSGGVRRTLAAYFETQKE